MTKDEFLQKLYNAPCGIFTIEKVVPEKDIEMCVEALKEVIRYKLYKGMDFDFSSDYKRFRKMNN